MARIFRSKVGWVCVALALLFLLTHSLWMSALGRLLVRAGNPVPADVVVVLAGDYTGNRILKAAELVRQGYAPKVLVSGPYGFYGAYECDPAIAFAVGRGNPAPWFVRLPHRAHSTVEEADVVVPELRRMGVRRYLLVTSNYHTARAGRTFRARAPDLDVHVVAAPEEFFDPASWWHSREGRKLVLVEWEKTLAMHLGL